MGYVLRKLEKTATRWETQKANKHLIDLHDMPADPLSDLQTKDNQLSVYFIDDRDISLKRLLAALATTRDKLQRIAYLLVDKTAFEKIVEDLQLIIDPEKGKVSDKQVSDWHRNLKNLSALKVQQLGFFLYTNAQPAMSLHEDLFEYIQSSLRVQALNKEKFQESLIKDLNEFERKSSKKVDPETK